MALDEKNKALDKKIEATQAQYNLDWEAAKISPLLSGKFFWINTT